MKCPICNTNGWEKFYTKLSRCLNCGFIRAQDKFFKVNSTELYGKNYFNSSDYGDYVKEQPALEKNFINRVERIKQYKKSGRLLEVGCAYGYFLKIAEDLFQCFGIDLNPYITQIAKGNTKAKIMTGDFINKKIPNNYFDLVCMFDTIEHLKYPEKYIEKVAKILKPNGLIVIETGDIESLMARTQKEKWRLITPPFHLQYFSQTSLTKLLNKFGFEVVQVDRVGFYRTIRQIIYKITNYKGVINSPLSFFSNSVQLNTFDLLFVIAQKIKTPRN